MRNFSETVVCYSAACVRPGSHAWHQCLRSKILTIFIVNGKVTFVFETMNC